jgi:hypothetical protein
VVLEASGLGCQGKHFEQKVFAIGKRIRLVSRPGVVDGDRLEQVVGVPYFSSPDRNHDPNFGPISVGIQGTYREVPGPHKLKTPVESTIWGFSLNSLRRPGTRLHVVDHHLTEA